MVNKFLLLAALFLSVSTLCFAEDQVITLKDGSQIKGELVGVSNGVYTITTPMLGNIQVNKDQITSIKTASAETLPPSDAQLPSTEFNQKAQAAQAQLMSNPELMSDMQQMLQDPEITQLIADPSIVQAVSNKDTAAVASNPRIQQLMQNPKMKALIEKLQNSSSK